MVILNMYLFIVISAVISTKESSYNYRKRQGKQLKKEQFW
jgi:hypothetical protein